MIGRWITRTDLVEITGMAMPSFTAMNSRQGSNAPVVARRLTRSPYSTPLYTPEAIEAWVTRRYTNKHIPARRRAELFLCWDAFKRDNGIKLDD